MITTFSNPLPSEVITFPDWFYSNQPTPPSQIKEQLEGTGAGGGVNNFSIGGSVDDDEEF